MSEKQHISLKQRFFLWAGTHVAGATIRMLKKTVSMTVVGGENLKETLAKHGRAIFVFWHGKMIIPTMRHIGDKIVVLVSEHGDGEIIARALLSLGFDLVRGSTTRGGTKALREMIQWFDEPVIIAITPDGPKGPYHELKIGAVVLAQRTGVPILPMSAFTNKPLLLKSWDRFHVVKPFEQCVLFYGKPIYIEKELTGDKLQEKCKYVEQTLHNLDQEAEAYFITKKNFKE